MDWIKEFFTKGWPTLMDAPFPFIVAFTLGLLGAKFYYQRQIKGLQGQFEGQIRGLQEQNNALKEQINVLKERISLYSDRLGLTEKPTEQLKSRVEEYLKKYAANKRGEWWELIKTETRPEIFVHDFKTKLKHHVVNPDVMEDLRFDWGSIRYVLPEELDSIETGRPINTKADS